MKREIRSLQTLCLRELGSAKCNAEISLAPSVPLSAQEERKKNSVKSINNKNGTKSSNSKDPNNMKQEERNARDGNPSSTSSLLLSLSRRPFHDENKSSNSYDEDKKEKYDTNSSNLASLNLVPVIRPEYGSGASGRRSNANDVDISTPWIACRSLTQAKNEYDNTNQESNFPISKKAKISHSTSSTSLSSQENKTLQHNNGSLVIEHGNPGVDCLQTYIDVLVELGRMNDSKLGVHFFSQWKECVLEGWKYSIRRNKNKNNSLPNAEITSEVEANQVQEMVSPKKKKKKKSKKRKISSVDKNNESISSSSTAAKSSSNTCQKNIINGPKGSLSLHNCATASFKTFNSIRQSNLGQYLDVLDLTGVHSLTDTLFIENIVKSCPKIRRLSLKNCRRITGKSIKAIQENLFEIEALDVGGSFNVKPLDLIDLAKHRGESSLSDSNSSNFSEKVKPLRECYVSGLGWTDGMLWELIYPLRNQLRGVSVGFSSSRVTGAGLLKALSLAKSTLERIALHFCDSVDTEIFAEMGKLFPQVTVWDIRGNAVTSLTPFLNARSSSSSAENGGQHCEQILILARYTSLSMRSLDESRTLYPDVFKCIIDGGGTGLGIRR